jgi:hypothetical protein
MKSGLVVVKGHKSRLTRQQQILAEISNLRERARTILILADKLEAVVLESPIEAA